MLKLKEKATCHNKSLINSGRDAIAEVNIIYDRNIKAIGGDEIRILTQRLKFVSKGRREKKSAVIFVLKPIIIMMMGRKRTTYQLFVPFDKENVIPEVLLHEFIRLVKHKEFNLIQSHLIK